MDVTPAGGGGGAAHTALQHETEAEAGEAAGEDANLDDGFHTFGEVVVPGYTTGEVLGRGKHGEVRKAVHEQSGVTVAIKIAPIGGPVDETTWSELAALEKMRHPHVVKLYDVVRTDKHECLVLECLSGGELFDYLVSRQRLADKEAQGFVRQILSAIDYCHSHGIIHRDLKLENLLLDDKGDIKITDFGFSNLKLDDGLCSTFVGSPAYAAPEILANEKYSGPAADVWSLGVIILTVLTGSHPFQDPNVAAKYGP